MESVHKLTLCNKDIRDAIEYWIVNYHGLPFEGDLGDNVNLKRTQEPITAVLKDTL